MKILHVLASNTYNGAENVVCQIMDMFKDDPDYQMIYCSPDGDINAKLRQLRIEYIPIESLTVDEIRRVIRQENPDIIHAHDRKAGLVCAVAKGDKRLIWHIHCNPDGVKKLSPESMGYIPAGKAAERILWVSKDAYNDFYFKKVFKDKSVVLENVVSAEKILNLAAMDSKEYNYDVIYVGRMEYPKNPERFVDIIHLLKKDIPDIRAAMAGTGTLEGSVKQHIYKSGLSDSIEYLGYLGNPYKLIQDSKVLLMTSRSEGLPMVQLEAEALGTYVVRTPGTDDELVNKVKECLQSSETRRINTDKYAEYKESLRRIYEGEYAERRS